MESADPSPPLAGVRIVSLAHQYPGPYAGLLLGDLGADVIVVERPGTGDPTRAFPAFFASLNRGKRSVALDLKQDEDRERLYGLVRDADVFMEGFRPGTAARLGVDHECLQEINPDLVYVSISGYGQDGPHRDRPGHDLSYQAVAGILHGQAESGQPAAPPSIAWGDVTAGLFAALGTLVGLTARRRRERGCYIDVSMLDGLVSVLTPHLAPTMNGDGIAGFPHGPGYGVFRTADGRLVTLSIAHEDQFWRSLCCVLGLEDVAHLDAPARRAQHDELHTRIEEAVSVSSLDRLAERLEDAGVPFGEVHRLEEVVDDTHVRARGLVCEVTTGRRDIRQPLVVDGVGFGPTKGVPGLGEHTSEILDEASGNPSTRPRPATDVNDRW